MSTHPASHTPPAPASAPRSTSRRGMLLGSAATAAALGLAACGGGAGGGGGDISEEIPADLTASIDFAIWDIAQRPAMEKIIEAFNEQYPNITVTISVTAFEEYWTKLQTQATGGDLPDVFWMNGPNVQLYASEGMLQDISAVPGIDTSNYPEGLNTLYTFEDVQYAVPKDFDTIAMWYNRDVLERAGVAEPDGSWTWDDYREASATITEKLGGEGIWGNPGGTENQAYIYPLVLQAGGFIVSEDGTESGYDSDAAIEAFTFLRGMVEDGTAPAPTFTTENKPQDVFNAGQAGLFWSGNWNAAVFQDSPVRDQIAVAPLPTGAQEGNVIHGIGTVMSAKGQNKDASAALLAFLGSEEANLIQAQEGAANPAFIGTNDAYVDALPEFSLQTFIDAAETASPYPVSKNTSAWLSMETDYFPQIVGGELSVEDGLGQLAEEMNGALADEQ